MSSLPQTRPCLSSCGGTMHLKATFKGSEPFGQYVCQNPKCRRSVIETAFPMTSDTTGADMPSRTRPGQEAAG
jgi:hypothetical protein